MNMNWFDEGWRLIWPILLSGIAGIGLIGSSFMARVRGMEKAGNGKPVVKAKDDKVESGRERKLHIFAGTVLLASVLLALAAVWSGERSLTLFHLMDDIPIFFHVDAAGRLFTIVISVIWLAAGFYAFLYMKHEGEEKDSSAFICSYTAYCLR